MWYNRDMKRLNTTQLKIIAIISMVCSHLSFTVFWGTQWLDVIGRIAFPIFAFLLAEGFHKTHDRKAYFKRLLLFAIISEIPFNLMAEGALFYPFHQNVLFTFVIAFIFMDWIEKAKGTPWFATRAALGCVAGYLLGFVTFVDYFGYGVLMVLTFYLFHDLKSHHIPEFLIMTYINLSVGGLVFPVNILNHTVEMPKQGFALLALIPIWMYNEKQGHKLPKYSLYIFYPTHMLLFYLLMHL